MAVMEDLGAVIEMPLKPTWTRYKDIFIRNRHLSIFRALEYELLSRIGFRGKILDLGGGEKAHYKNLIMQWGEDIEYESVNIDPKMNPTYVGDANGSLDVPADHYDMVISFNTLEHIYDLDNALDQLIRAIQPGGRMVLGVPFLYRIHASPQDYHRPTATWWIETLKRKGVRKVEIQPVFWDVYTSGLSVIEGRRIWHVFGKLLIPFYGILHAFIYHVKRGERYPRGIGDNISAFALGYVISAYKQDRAG